MHFLLTWNCAHIANAAMENGIASVKKNALDAKVDDQTAAPA